MKLYYIHQSCALAAHIVALEAGIAVEPVKVDTPSKRLPDGSDYHAVNPKGWVPAIALDDGQVLTENGAVLQYLADLKPEAGLAPPHGTLARARLQEMLHYIGTDLHRGYSPLFNPTTPAPTREERSASLRRHYTLLDQQLAGRGHLVGGRFSVADAYLFALTRWAPMVRLDLSAFSHLQAFQRAVAARPAVRAAMQAQGLAPE
jgi:glutathione S-transferase